MRDGALQNMDENEWEIVDTAIEADFELVDNTSSKIICCACNTEGLEASFQNLKVSLVRVQILTVLNKVALNIFVAQVEGGQCKENIDSSVSHD
jgi:hypothetical protein